MTIEYCSLKMYFFILIYDKIFFFINEYFNFFNLFLPIFPLKFLQDIPNLKYNLFLYIYFQKELLV